MAIQTHIADKKSHKIGIFVCGAPFVDAAQPKTGDKPTCPKCAAQYDPLAAFGDLFGMNPNDIFKGK